LIAKTLNPRQLIQAIEEYSIVNIIAVPEIYELLFRTIGENGLPSTLKRLVSGGSTLTAEKHRIYEKTFGVQVIHGYGLTEFAPVSGNIFGNTRGTMGPVGPLIKYRIVDKELQIMGSAITAGYYRREKETREAFDDSWFLTGDYCRMDNGHLVFTGEKKSTCKVNGNLVDLVEVSNAVRSYPGIEKAEIKFKDSQLIAEIAFSKDADNDPKSLRRYLGGLIAGYKIPRFVVQDVMK
jgi:long-chain acyl-CoA synthetase